MYLDAAKHAANSEFSSYLSKMNSRVLVFLSFSFLAT